MKSLIISFFMFILLLNNQCYLLAQTKVNTTKVVDNGIQPKVKIDKDGNLHLLYYKGEAKSGNLFYTKKIGGDEYSKPIRVNSIDGSAVSGGTIRGAQFSIDQENNVYVVWNGSHALKENDNQEPPLYFTMLKANAKEFDKQKAVSGEWPMDGGGAVATDQNQNVYVFWHSGKTGSKEEDRNIFISKSSDGGKTFSEANIISPTGLGVCSCCAMQAQCDVMGNLYVAYRTAQGKNRDIHLLVSTDKGKSFKNKIVEAWEVKTCPMSSISFCETHEKMLMSWESNNKIRFTEITKGSTTIGDLHSPDSRGKMNKHPVLATSKSGNILLAWVISNGWAKEGSLAWQEFDKSLQAVSETKTETSNVSVWSFVGTYFDRKSNEFYILY